MYQGYNFIQENSSQSSYSATNKKINLENILFRHKSDTIINTNDSWKDEFGYVINPNLGKGATRIGDFRAKEYALEDRFEALFRIVGKHKNKLEEFHFNIIEQFLKKYKSKYGKIDEKATSYQKATAQNYIKLQNRLKFLKNGVNNKADLVLTKNNLKEILDKKLWETNTSILMPYYRGGTIEELEQIISATQGTKIYALFKSRYDSLKKQLDKQVA